MEQYSLKFRGQLLSDAADFLRKFYFNLSISDEEIYNVIKKHIEYGTMDIVYRGEKVIAGCRWNISETGKICDVLDYYCIQGEDGSKIAKHLIARNWSRFPALEYIRFKRMIKYPTREERLYPIRRILHLKGV